MSTLLFGAGGGELGDSCSISLPCLFVGDFAFRLDFGVIGSSSSLASSLVFLFSFWLRSAARHSSVEWPLRSWKAQYLLRSYVDDFCGELFTE